MPKTHLPHRQRRIYPAKPDTLVEFFRPSESMMPVNNMHDEVERLLTDTAAPELAASRNPLIRALVKDHPLTSTRAQ